MPLMGIVPPPSAFLSDLLSSLGMPPMANLTTNIFIRLIVGLRNNHLLHITKPFLFAFLNNQEQNEVMLTHSYQPNPIPQNPSCQHVLLSRNQ